MYRDLDRKLAKVLKFNPTRLNFFFVREKNILVTISDQKIRKSYKNKFKSIFY